MPRQITSIDEFNRLLERASECRVVRRGDKIKLKLRTKRILYTYVTDDEEADKLLKELKIRVIEL